MATTSTKKQRIPKTIISLTYLLKRSLNSLDARKFYGDTCLHSTISELANQHSIVFVRKNEPHIHRHGGKTHFMRYWLAESHTDSAIKLVRTYLPDFTLVD